jgi:hypothetical protein
VGCAADPVCTVQNPNLDPPNLRCFEQKRRFGMDFLYPTERYVNALSKPRICPEVTNLDCDSDGSPVPNPLFENPGGRPRDPSRVVVAGSRLPRPTEPSLSRGVGIRPILV